MRRLAPVARFPWYPTMLAGVFVAEIMAVNAAGPGAALRPMLVLAAIALTVTAVCVRLLGVERAGITAAFLVIGLIAVRDLPTALVFLAAFPVLAADRVLVRRGGRGLPWGRIHETLTVLVAILFVVEVGRVGLLRLQESPEIPPDAAWTSAILTAAAGDTLPDIFILIADAHGRPDFLRTRYGYDPAPFVGALAAEGFETAEASHTNYVLTQFSLASLLTGRYMEDLGQDLAGPASEVIARTAIERTGALPLLERAGYETIVVSGGYEGLGLRGVHRFIDTGQPNEFESAVVNNTAPARLVHDAFESSMLEFVRARTHGELDAAGELAWSPAPGPQFVLVHLPVPHWPYVFREDCGAMAPAEALETDGGGTGSSPREARRVAAQTMCVDTLLAPAASEIVRARPDAVVILMSDHGPGVGIEKLVPTADGLAERSASFFSARTPGRPGLFPDDITIVNVLPILLNAYAGTNLPLQEDRLYFGPDPANGRLVRVPLPGETHP